VANRSGKRRELVEAEILERAALVFATQGFASSSLQDVADAAQISRPALYHYISSKEDLLVKLVEGVTFRIAQDLQDIAAKPAPARERLQQAIERIATLMIEQPSRFRLLERAESELPHDLAEQHRKARMIARDAVTRIVDDGVKDGTFVPCEPRVVAFAVLGMTNWIAWWIHSEPDLTADQVVDTMTNLVTDGIVARTGDAFAAGADDLSRVLRTMKANLAQLERLIAERDESTTLSDH
jgi:AcrR family transcriptional regulator